MPDARGGPANFFLKMSMIPWWLIPLVLDMLIIYVAAMFYRDDDMAYNEFNAAAVLIIGLFATVPIWAVCAFVSLFFL